MSWPASARRLRHRARSAVLTIAVLGSLAMLSTAGASFTSATGTVTVMSAAATFPDYPATVTSDGAGLLHRFEEAPSPASSSVAADSAGTPEPGTYSGRTDGPSTQWDLSEGSGTQTADSSGAANPGTLGGAGVSWTTGRTGNGLAFDGSPTGYVSGAGPAVATNVSYTISAWAYLAGPRPGSNRAVAGQSGSVVSGVNLLYESSTQKWMLYIPAWDSLNSPFTPVRSTAIAAVNTWTHLVGVYDSSAAASQQARLYVDAGLPTTSSLPPPWSATGPLQAGRDLFDGVYGDYFPGMIDDVRTYRRALSPAEITALYNGTTPATGMTLGLPGALQGAQQGQQSSTAAGFNGTTNAYNDLTTSAPTAFTVECWFTATGNQGGALIGFSSYTTGLAAGGSDRNVYLDGGNRVTFAVWTGAAQQTIRTSASYNDGRWHHLAASMGAAGMRLYVDGALAGTNPNQVGEVFTGYWRFGGTWLSNYPDLPANQYFTGSLDEVATYGTQLTDQQIAWHFHADH